MQLHPAKTIRKTLSRTASGRICVSDIKDVYSAFLYCLQLAENDGKSGSILQHLSFKRSYPYSFTVKKGLDTLQSLSFDINQQNLTSTIKYAVSEPIANELLKLFFKAKLLHSPDEKTRSMISDNEQLLQPTSKGVAILQRFCEKNGILTNREIIPKILKSNFNSMDLICFERNPVTDRIIHNEYWDKLLFQRMMGPEKNYWSPRNGPDEVPEEMLNRRVLESYSLGGWISEGEREQAPDIISNHLPFYHRYFTNPDSDSHVQYYVSGKGIRLFKDKVIYGEDHDTSLPYCFTGKAIVQYLMDCTDIMFRDEAVRIGEAFEGLNLMKKVERGKKDGFVDTREGVYIVSEEGKSIVKWDKEDSEVSLVSPTLVGVDLKSLLRDPGLKYLFREYLVESYCAENLDGYEDIEGFQRRYEILKKLVKIRKSERIVNHQSAGRRTITVHSAIDRLSKDCMTRVYSIYSSYMVDGAVNELNIDSKLRMRIQKEMNKCETPISLSGEVTKEVARRETRETREVPTVVPEEAMQVSEQTIEAPKRKSEDPLHLRTPPPPININKVRLLEVSPTSPTDFLLGGTLATLENMNRLFDRVKRQLYLMMEQDSLPKFVNSEGFREAAKLRRPKERSSEAKPE